VRDPGKGPGEGEARRGGSLKGLGGGGGGVLGGGGSCPATGNRIQFQIWERVPRKESLAWKNRRSQREGATRRVMICRISNEQPGNEPSFPCLKVGKKLQGEVKRKK